MNGLLEQILAAIQENTAALREGRGGGGTIGNGGGVNAQQYAGQTGAPVALSPPATPATVTADQLTGLIMPHIANEAIKAALGVAMRANGVNNLPEAQPHQYPALYAAFQQVLAQHGAGAPSGAVVAATSII